MKKYLILILIVISSNVSCQITDQISFQNQNFNIGSKNQYTVIENKISSTYTTQDGSPKLPMIYRRYVLPMGSTVTGITSTVGSKTLLGNNFLVSPAVTPCHSHVEPCVEIETINPSIYNSASNFPANIAEISADEKVLGYHIVTIGICPFEYSPKNKTLSLCNQITVNINYNSGQMTYSGRISEKRHKANKAYVRSIVQNPDLISESDRTALTIIPNQTESDKLFMYWKPSDVGAVPDYIILTSQDLKSQFEQFATYKTQKGIKTLVVNVEDIYKEYPGLDKQEKIRNYLKSAYNFWSAGLYVLLGGDTAIIPGRIGSQISSLNYNESNNYTDFYYCDVFKEGDEDYNWNSIEDSKIGWSLGGSTTRDFLELGMDNFIGRAPISNSDDLANFIQKVTSYESLTNVTQRNYVNNLLFIGSYVEYNRETQTPEYVDLSGQPWFTNLANMPFMLRPDLNKWLLFDNHTDSTYPGNEELSRDTALQRLNFGHPTNSIGKFHFVAHHDHGIEYGIGMSSKMKGESVYREDMDNLSNQNYYQIMYATDCLAGAFNSDCIAEHYINATNGGGVAIMANSGSVNPGGQGQTKEFFRSLYENPTYESNILGNAFSKARDAVIDYPYRKKQLTLFGEPTMAIWSNTPQDIVVIAPTSININNTAENNLQIAITPINTDALVSLYKFNSTTYAIELYASKTIPQLSSTADFIINPDTEGILKVTVTALNYIPAHAEVAIVLPQAHLYISDYDIIDANGNGIIEQGETVTLKINLTNSGNETITNINTVLSSNQSSVNILSNQFNLNQLSPGQTAELLEFSFIVNNTTNIIDVFELLLNITADGGYLHNDNIFIEAKNPIIEINQRILTDNSGTPIASSSLGTTQNSAQLYINLGNIGNLPSGLLNASLNSNLNGSSLNITTSTSTYNNINSSAQGQNLTPFQLQIPQPITGPLVFTLTITNQFQKSWSFDFDLNETSPQLISGFNFTSTTEEISLKWNRMQNIKGYNVYKCAQIDGNFIKVNNSLIVGASTYTDLDVEPETSYYYKISVVSPSMYELPLNQIATNKAWTTVSNFNDFPIETHVSNVTKSSVAVCDMDGNGSKEIFVLANKETLTVNGKILGVDKNGEELFNPDNLPQTFTSFIDTNIRLVDNMTTGDLDNDGHAEILFIGRDSDLNIGRLYVFKTVDLDNDGRPDKFWENEYINLSGRTNKNPVLFDIDKNGFLDIIVADEHQTVYAYDKDGHNLPGWPQIVGAADWSEGTLAVSDIDHDGKGEIALGLSKFNGTKGAIFIWNHDGTAFSSTNPFKEFADNENADNAIVFADLDHDQNQEIIITTRISSYNIKLYVFKTSGEPFSNFGAGLSLASYGPNPFIIPKIAVGDLDGDSNLEIVFATYQALHVINKDGMEIAPFPKTIPTDSADYPPVLADLDNDNGIEILINHNNILTAYNLDGSICQNFPLEGLEHQSIVSSPTIADIDQDGKSEIIAATTYGTIHVWKTTGNASKIEWASYRANAHNTGTYKEVCNNIVDLAVFDGPDDDGSEPNTRTQYMWASNNIWIRRNFSDTSNEHENPQYDGVGSVNHIKVKVRNNSCVDYIANQDADLTVRWAKASTYLSYPEPWFGGVSSTTGASMGNLVGTLPIPSIPAGQEITMTFPWSVPDPDDYGSETENWHFCLLAMVEGTVDPAITVTGDLNETVRKSNNLAWKNITVIDATGTGEDLGGIVAVGNPTEQPKMYYLEMAIADQETGKPIYQEAEVGVKMDEDLYRAWSLGGKEAQKLDPTFEENRKLVKGNHVILDKLSFQGHEYGKVHLNFNFLTREMTEKTNFVYHVIQKEWGTGKIIGGETFLIKKVARPPFEADAGDDKEVDLNEPIIISATDINEPAIYNWYNSSGELVFEGKDLSIANAAAEKYKLEVISTIDGFKDYSEVEVILKPNRLVSFSPNPVTENINVTYKLNEASSAYIMIVSYYMNGNISNNYVVDVNSSATSINMSNYPNGFYKMVLVVNGSVVDAKLLFKL